MHKIFTIFLFATVFALSLSAQDPACMPGQISADTSIILPEPYNFVDMDGGLDSTCIGLFYEQVLTTLAPATVPFGGQEFAIDSLSIDVEGAIDGLPPGFDYACNPPSCVFLPEEEACIVITGMTDETITPGTYDLSLRIRAFNFLAPTGLLLTYPDDLGNPDESYFINVAAQDTCNVTITSTIFLQDNLTSFIAPNPTASYTELKVNSRENMDLQMVLTDILGKVHVQQPISIVSGQNVIPLQVQDLSQGIYFMNLTNGKEFISHKLVIEK